VLIDPLGISTSQARIGNFFYAVTPKAEGGQYEARELLFLDPNSELAMGAVPDQMPPEAYLLFYKAQMVGARLGWKPPYLYNPRLKERLFRVKTPTFIVWANEDKLAPVALAETFKAGIPGAEVALIPGAAHALLLEHPQHAAALVSQFLKR
jgi:pimeloyl-ACP methyl ester carboxylesterase